MNKINSVERNDIIPLCPHCNEPVETVGFRVVASFLGKRYIYFCLKCKKVLGVSDRKGFWQG